ncbi:hypothetical protein [Polynucleobacter sp. JS-Polo-80-F4]|uniref:hypothetical protein n=1 Tax=Polynucleobacter sp. JS-Polo-80-F4 TaxID=2576918 RepID=UPI001C0D8A64|nr:hypothetical protein [Polynucleobacter sp. JS-Polo-80-F4]MBU3616725.1 hypothetical protein [Polynucleobacter sp. JS-Polo-80-F4]
MGAVSSFLKPLKEYIKYRLRWRYLWKEWFLGRHACLGYDVLKHFDNLPTEVNFQKGRVDLLLSYWGDRSLLPKSSLIARFMARKDVLPLIRQLEFFDCLPRRAPKFIFMDSFAELTDQLFFNKLDKWQFCCGYSDLAHSEVFSEQYECSGHMPSGRLKSAYTSLFDLFERRWGKVPIYFLHFPIALETRPIYIERYHAIALAIQEISKTRSNVFSVEVDGSKVHWPSDAPENIRSFPYHYEGKTYLMFKENIGRIL